MADAGPQSDLVVVIRPQVDQLVAHYRGELVRMNVLTRPPGRPLTGAELLTVNWADVTTRFLASLQGVLAAAGGTPEQRRAAAVAAGVQFFQQAVRPLLAQYAGGGLLFDLFIGPALDRLVPALVGGLYDGLVRVTAKADPGPADPPAAGDGPAGFVPY